ncbi:hypothetical protein G6F16_002184 [Rhizopus arrhizus]|uniref:Uncharacterized protein n=1 Tax=Rhizopus oryzae TaxID=64495 RepID=A0A9P7BW56_RHIOR|nr:hypothetical protein G6F23_005331 [Rhizopus arrhizus]KAG0768929.1 hypothetical protein G6F24_001512 [Rhizopus arrhizus]KAG0798066.1 hypothetical protein G6F21_000004 [Rhizopus arrhizus]KAG0800224.1 hypothetical protein G6F22_002446 [Rhizopus arrhizus]KAG0816927.1 hypothetical protein G6F20_002803 [Rhizopus arrhizus]
MAFYQLVRLFEALSLPIFNCFPLCRTWISGYETIDSKCLCQNILGRTWSPGISEMNLWAEMMMNSADLKLQELGVFRFRGTIQIDGVSVTILKKRQARKH